MNRDIETIAGRVFPDDLLAFLNAHAADPRVFPALNPQPTYHWITRHSGIPWLQVDLPFPAEAMYGEASRLRERFVTHRARDSRGWSSLCVLGISAQHTLSARAYGYTNDAEAPYDWTDIADKAPVTVAFLRSLPFRRLYRARFMRLDPGGYILPHHDRSESVIGGELNLALNNPHGARFVMEQGGTLPLSTGAAVLPDLSNRHALINNGAEPRYHMIVHISSALPEWESMVTDAYRKAAD